MPVVKRLKENPLISPNPKSKFADDSVFNGCPIIDNDKKTIHLVCRAVSSEKPIANHNLKVSSIAYAKSTDGINFTNIRQLIKPEESWERFGCEDPRITKINNQYFIFYTALSTYPFSAEGIKVGLAITKDFKKIEKHPITPFNSKAMTLFPERINGKLAALLSVHTDSPPAKNCLAFFDKVEDMWSEQYWREWYYSLPEHEIDLELGTKHLVEIGAPPIKTKYGWLLIYANVRDYHSPNPTLFGIEAALLDLKDPKKIIGMTNDPLLVPQEDYELYGKVPNVIFPSGAIVKNKDLYIYYGGADTHLCAAKVPFKKLIDYIYHSGKKVYDFERYSKNPILEPTTRNAWEAKAVFNPAAINLGGKKHILYRAMSNENVSVVGYASSKDGFKIDKRLNYPVYTPREDFEKGPDLSGCEDARIVKIGNLLYMTYTAYNGITPRVALTSIKPTDFLNHEWNWAKPILISPPNVENKNCVIFPEKVKGKYVLLHRPNNKDIWIDFFSDLNFKNKFLGGKVLFSPRPGRWDSLKIGAAAPPIKIKEGWLLIYHGISSTSRHYRVGAALLDAHNPRKVLARTLSPLLSPQMNYEEEGQVRNVVFPCGVVKDKQKIIIYYGGADSVVGVASISLANIMKALLEK